MTQRDQLSLDDRWVTAIRGFADDEVNVEEGWTAVMSRSEGGDAYGYTVPSHPRARRRTVIVAMAAGVMVAAALTATVVWAAGGERTNVASEDSRPAVPDTPPRGRDGGYPVEGVIETDIPLDASIVSRVARVLPAGSRIVWAVDRRNVTKPDGVNAIELNAVVDRVGYEVTVYRRFNLSELDGLEGPETEWGTVWVGATDPDITSIYFLSTAGVGLRVAYLNSPGEATATVEHLTSIAVALATDPVIAEEATA